jgi:stalled ribosome rescue protein Dom34
MAHFHAVLWIDHAESRIFSFNRDDVDSLRIHSTHRHQHLHHKAGAVGAGKEGIDVPYFGAVADALKDFGEVLIVGPGNAKDQFVAYVHAQHPDLREKITDVETVDHPTDGEITALARKHFKTADRMRPSPIPRV